LCPMHWFFRPRPYQETFQQHSLQVLASHLFLQPPPSSSRSGGGSGSSSSRAPLMALPAQSEYPWLPSDAVAVSSTVAGYPFLSPIHAGNPKLGLARILGSSGTPAVQNVSAHIYRYLLRALTMWPAGQAKESLTAVFDLWLAVCLPWQLHPGGRFSKHWENHVLSHLPFYILLFPTVLHLLQATAAVSARHAYQHLNQIAMVCPGPAARPVFKSSVFDYFSSSFGPLSQREVIHCLQLFNHLCPK
jgi:hypothetical protein